MAEDLSELEDALKEIEGSDKKEEGVSEGESALVSEGPSEQKGGETLPREQEIGFHKGALNTLINERNELVRMVNNVETIMQAHLKRLKELEGNEGKN